MVGRQRVNVTGTTGNAVVFPGTTGIGIKRALLSSSTGDYSVAAWLNITGLPASRGVICKNGRQGIGNGGWKFAINSAGRLQLSDPGGAWGGTATTALSLSTWTHIAWIKSSGTSTFYVNGVADGNFSGTFNNPENDFTVGCTYNDSSVTYVENLNGKLDDLYVWTRAIDPINELPLLITPHQYQTVSTASMAVWYKFDETTGASTVADYSGNNRTGTVIGSPTFSTGTVVTPGVADRVAATGRLAATGRIVASS